MKKIFIFLFFTLFATSVTDAKTLKIGVASDALSMDPYFKDEVATSSILSNMFDGLVSFDKDLKIHPDLATSWSNPRPTEWILNLRKGIRFHNGNTFNADDVVFSFDRIKHWAKSGFQDKVNMIVSAQKIDDYTVKFITKRPFPVFLKKMTYVKILDKETLKGKSDDWIANHPVGTGPYALLSWSRGDHIAMKANPAYWQGRAPFDELIFKPLSNDPTRVAAILSGEVDLINRVPVTEVKRVKKNSDVRFFEQPGLRLIYLQMDQFRNHSPHMKSPTGKNPFKELKVRQAIYYGINEEGIVKYIMHGFAKPAAQFSPSAVFGSDPAIKRVSYNPKKAKELLAEAGYPDGFDVQIDSPNNRYVQDAQITEAVASSLAKIGIRVSVNAIPKSRFFSQISSLNTSFFLVGWENSDGDLSSMLNACIHSYNEKKGYGRYNYGRFSNAKVDKLIEASADIMQPKKRLHYLQEVQKTALLQEQCIIPLHFQVDLYAAKKTIAFQPRLDGKIWAYDIQPNMKEKQ
ncbi:ABC transporter substrate-binding protein [Sulfurovum sp. NBC37-1]|uniref:ABC transporter substrate-binding protein n=1 Tax=Sulfurovum sp. (strain NBC37-1) TaxID=387093 RepID=UPI00015875F8|nr:ABC transporter substrate-binding protein [Sulfurovum sp. NBC37-1]BAF71849.1 dipeptide ABC transporter, substrate-binding protein [Sulfurovum sp. NBC37-1]